MSSIGYCSLGGSQQVDSIIEMKEKIADDLVAIFQRIYNMEFNSSENSAFPSKIKKMEKKFNEIASKTEHYFSGVEGIVDSLSAIIEKVQAIEKNCAPSPEKKKEIRLTFEVSGEQTVNVRGKDIKVQFQRGKIQNRGEILSANPHLRDDITQLERGLEKCEGAKIIDLKPEDEISNESSLAEVSQRLAEICKKLFDVRASQGHLRRTAMHLIKINKALPYESPSYLDRLIELCREKISKEGRKEVTYFLDSLRKNSSDSGFIISAIEPLLKQ